MIFCKNIFEFIAVAFFLKKEIVIEFLFWGMSKSKAESVTKNLIYMVKVNIYITDKKINKIIPSVVPITI